MSSELPFSIPDSIAHSLADFTGRAWVFHRLDAWLTASGPSIFLLTGGPGSGKSTIAARLVQLSTGEITSEEMPHRERQWLACAHFCQAQVDSTLNPLRFVESLSEHLANRYLPFKMALTKTGIQQNITISPTVSANVVEAGADFKGVVVKINVGSITARRAFDLLVLKPLAQICTVDFRDPIIILVDSLDEALTFDPDENIVTLLGRVTTDLPTQVRFLLTSRPTPQILDSIGPSSLDLVEDLPKRGFLHNPPKRCTRLHLGISFVHNR